MGGSGVGKVDTPEGVGRLEGFGKRLLSGANPSRRMLLAQLDEALGTGSVMARVPLMQRAVESGALNASDALENAQERLAASGRAGTPFGLNALAGTRAGGALATSQVATNLLQPFVRAAPSILGAFQGQGVSALTGASGMRLEQEMFNDSQTRMFFQDLKDSLQSLATYGQSSKEPDPLRTFDMPTSSGEYGSYNVPTTGSGPGVASFETYSPPSGWLR